jgi:hypothetical protein
MYSPPRTSSHVNSALTGQTEILITINMIYCNYNTVTTAVQRPPNSINLFQVPEYALNTYSAIRTPTYSWSSFPRLAVKESWLPSSGFAPMPRIHVTYIWYGAARPTSDVVGAPGSWGISISFQFVFKKVVFHFISRRLLRYKLGNPILRLTKKYWRTVSTIISKMTYYLNDIYSALPRFDIPQTAQSMFIVRPPMPSTVFITAFIVLQTKHWAFLFASSPLVLVSTIISLIISSFEFGIHFANT